MGREMPIKRRSARLSSGERRRSTRLATAAAAAAVRAPGQLKQQIQPTILSPSSSTSCPYQLRKKHKLKQQIQPTILYMNSSSSLPNQLMSEHEETGKKKPARRWRNREDRYLVKLTNDQALAELYQVWKGEFYKKAAARLNAEFGKEPNFVPFTAENVEHKLRDCRRAYKKSEDTSSVTPAVVLFNQFGPAFRSAKGTSSGTPSGAPHALSGPFTSPATGEAVEEESTVEVENLTAALKDLRSYVCSYTDLYEHALVLNNKVHLDVFWAYGSNGQRMEQKINYLKETYKSVQSFPVVQEYSVSADKSKRDALGFMIQQQSLNPRKPFSTDDLNNSSCVLEDKAARDVFWALDTYLERRSFLLNMHKKPWQSSSCQLSRQSDEMQYITPWE
ncbi:hypothetical protein ACP4OV_029515 [Aristida adscensionis]